MVRRVCVVVLLGFALSFATGAAMALPGHDVPPPKTGTNAPPSGLWGETLQDDTEKGLGKATGNAYNYRHIAFAAGLMAVVGVGLVLLIRQQTAKKRR